RQAAPRPSPKKWPAQGHAGLDALLEGGGARRIIAAEAHAPHADASGIEIAALFHGVDHRRHRDLVVAADGEVVLAFALARPVERERRQAARQERLLVGVALLLARVEAHSHDPPRPPSPPPPPPPTPR